MPIVSESTADIVFTVCSLVVIGSGMIAFWAQSVRDQYNALHISDAVTKAGIAEESAGKAHERAADIEKEAAVARLDLQKLRQVAAPRHLTSDQREKLGKLLADGPKGIVYVIPKSFDEEAEGYASEIADLLVAAGFELKEPQVRPLSFGVGGTLMFVRDMGNPPPHAGFIQTCLKSVGIEMPGYATKEAWVADGAIIAVGVKPFAEPHEAK